MKFRQYFSLKHILFALFLFAILLPFAFFQSSNMVKVSFEANGVEIYSSRYSMSIDYASIASVELTDLPDAGEKVEDGYDDDLVRTGKWHNNLWGDYYICADLDVSNCVVITHADGRLFVFSRKNDKTTAALYEELLTHITQ